MSWTGNPLLEDFEDFNISHNTAKCILAFYGIMGIGICYNVINMLLI